MDDDIRSDRLRNGDAFADIHATDIKLAVICGKREAVEGFTVSRRPFNRVEGTQVLHLDLIIDLKLIILIMGDSDGDAIMGCSAVGIVPCIYQLVTGPIDTYRRDRDRGVIIKCPAAAVIAAFQADVVEPFFRRCAAPRLKGLDREVDGRVALALGDEDRSGFGVDVFVVIDPLHVDARGIGLRRAQRVQTLH